MRSNLAWCPLGEFVGVEGPSYPTLLISSRVFYVNRSSRRPW